MIKETIMPTPTTSWQTAAGSVSSSNRINRAFYVYVQAAAIKALAANVSEPLKSRLSHRADDTISALTRSLSAKPPSPLIPNPWPTPSAAAMGLATRLTIFANALQPGVMRDALESIGGSLVDAAFSVGHDHV
jgi:hypothetical protein